MVPSGPGFESPPPWGQIGTKVPKHVAEPILAPESRFRGIRKSFFKIYLFPPVLGSPWHVAVLRAPWDAHGHGRHARDPLLRAMRDGIIATATVRDDVATNSNESTNRFDDRGIISPTMARGWRVSR